VTRAVIDASVGAALLFRNVGDLAERAVSEYESLHAPSHFDVECASVLRRLYLQRDLTAAHLRTATLAMADLPVERVGPAALLERIASLADNATAYDAAYLALAEGLDAVLLTSDRRLATVPGVRCPVRVLQ